MTTEPRKKTLRRRGVVVAWLVFFVIWATMFLRQAISALDYVLGVLVLVLAVAVQVFTFRENQTPIEKLLSRKKRKNM